MVNLLFELLVLFLAPCIPLLAPPAPPPPLPTPAFPSPQDSLSSQQIRTTKLERQRVRRPLEARPKTSFPDSGPVPRAMHSTSRRRPPSLPPTARFALKSTTSYHEARASTCENAVRSSAGVRGSGCRVQG